MPEEQGCADETWYFLDFADGTPVRCARSGWLECATRTEKFGCQWGGMYKRAQQYQRLAGVVSASATYQSRCPGWVPNDGSDPCEELGCYGNGSDFCQPKPRPPLPIFQADEKSFLFEVEVNAVGRVSISDNKDHDRHAMYSVAVATIGALPLIVVGLSVCLAVSCCKLRARGRAVRALDRIRSRQSAKLAALRTRRAILLAPNDDDGDEDTNPPGSTDSSAVSKTTSSVRISWWDDEAAVGAGGHAARVGSADTPLPMWDVMYADEEPKEVMVDEHGSSH